MNYPLQFNRQCRKIERPGTVLDAPEPGLTIGDLSEEIAHMADTSHYPDSGEKSNTQPWRFGLTRQQKALLNFIVSFSEANGGVMPSFDEMADHLGLASKSGVHRLVTALEGRGHIARDGRRARAIRLTGGGDAKATLDEALSRVLGECLLSSHTRHELSRILSARRKR